MAGLEFSGSTRGSEEVAGMIDQLMSDIYERGGEQAALRARLLLDHVISTSPPGMLHDLGLLRARLVEQATSYVQSSGGEPESHLRLVAACHVLINMLRPVVEGTDDEYITTEYEELRDGLDDLERLDISNPSMNNRLSSILEELIGLSGALGIMEPAVPEGRQ